MWGQHQACNSSYLKFASFAALTIIGCVGAAAGLGQTPQAAVGVLGLHPETVQRALTDHALGLLLPPAVLVTFQPCDPPGDPDQPPTESEIPVGSSLLQGSASDHQSSATAPQSYALSANQQSNQQSSQQKSHGLESSRPSDSGYGWRRLSGGPDGAGFGGNRGFLWAMVAPVGNPIPMTMKVRLHPSNGGSLKCYKLIAPA